MSKELFMVCSADGIDQPMAIGGIFSTLKKANDCMEKRVIKGENCWINTYILDEETNEKPGFNPELGGVD